MNSTHIFDATNLKTTKKSDTIPEKLLENLCSSNITFNGNRWDSLNSSMKKCTHTFGFNLRLSLAFTTIGCWLVSITFVLLLPSATLNGIQNYRTTQQKMSLFHYENLKIQRKQNDKECTHL